MATFRPQFPEISNRPQVLRLLRQQGENIERDTGMSNVLPHRLRQFFKDTQGTASIESVLWLPVFFAFFSLMVDASMIFNGHSRIMRVVQDGNRNLSVGRLDTENGVEDWVSEQLTTLSDNVTVDTQIVAGVATTTAVVPAVDLEILGLFSAFNSLNISVTSQHYIEF